MTKDELIELIESYDSLAVTSVPGLGKTTLLDQLEKRVVTEREKILSKNKGIVTLKDQKRLMIENVKELMHPGIYDRHAIVDGYVFYCITGEYLIDKARAENDKRTLRKVSKELKEFKEWFWLFVTDFLRYVPNTFNILFLKSSVSKEVLLSRITDRNRERDNYDLMKLFVDRFEDFALRTLKEVRALGVNINLIEEVYQQ